MTNGDCCFHSIARSPRLRASAVQTLFPPGAHMIVMKFGGTLVQDAQAIDCAAAIVRERRQRKIFSSPKPRPTTRQVSGHEFTRAAKNCFSQTNRHPELPSMRARFHQRPNRGE